MESKMKNKLITVAVIAILIAIGSAYACYQTKQCCKRDYKGLQCITKCDYQYCPYDYPIEVK